MFIQNWPEKIRSNKLIKLSKLVCCWIAYIDIIYTINKQKILIIYKINMNIAEFID